MSEIKVDTSVRVPNLLDTERKQESTEDSFVKELVKKKPLSFRSDGSSKGLEERVDTLKRAQPLPINPEADAHGVMTFDNCAYATAFSQWSKN